MCDSAPFGAHDFAFIILKKVQNLTLMIKINWNLPSICDLKLMSSVLICMISSVKSALLSTSIFSCVFYLSQKNSKKQRHAKLESVFCLSSISAKQTKSVFEKNISRSMWLKNGWVDQIGLWLLKNDSKREEGSSHWWRLKASSLIFYYFIHVSINWQIIACS